MSDIRPATARTKRRGRAPYLGPAARRPDLVKVALDLFVEGGFAATTVDVVAERGGVSKAVVYDCFPGGKEELYRAVLDHAVGALPTSDRRPPAVPLEAIRAEVMDLIAAAERRPSAFHLLFGAPGTLDERIARRWRAARVSVESPVRARIARALGAGADEIAGDLLMAALLEGVRLVLAREAESHQVADALGVAFANGLHQRARHASPR